MTHLLVVLGYIGIGLIIAAITRAVYDKAMFIGYWILIALIWPAVVCGAIAVAVFFGIDSLLHKKI